MPRSRSRSMESRTCSCISRSCRPPQSWINRSASVDLPWSTCAMIEKLRMRCITELGCPGGRGARIIASRPLEQPQQLRAIQPMAADRDRIEQQHRYLQTVAPLQLRIGIDIDYGQWRQRGARGKRAQLGEHLLTQAAVGTRQQRQRAGGPGRCAQRLPPPRAGPGEAKAGRSALKPCISSAPEGAASAGVAVEPAAVDAPAASLGPMAVPLRVRTAGAFGAASDRVSSGAGPAARIDWAITRTVSGGTSPT